MESLKEKRVLLTGATGGIGAQVAALLMQSGAKVFVTARDEEKLKALASKYRLAPEAYFPADLTDENQVAALKETCLKYLEATDIIINASGIGIIKPMEQLALADFQQTLAINLVAPFLLMKHFLPGMKERKKGLIINIPGVLGKTPMAGAAAYAASKYGLTGMMQSIREEVKRTDIRITNLYLGGVDTPFWDEIDLRVQREKMVQAEEAAKAIWFLCQQPVSGVVSEMVLQPFNHQAI